MLKNRQAFYGLLLIVCFTVFLFGNRLISEANQLTDIETIANIVIKEQGEISEWSLYAREEISTIESEKEFHQFQTKLAKDFPQFQWHVEENDHSIKAIGTSPKNETIQLLATPKNGKFQSYLLLEKKGSSWDDNSKAEAVVFQEKMDNYLKGNTTFFSCIKGEFSDKIDKVLSDKEKQLMQAFQIKEVESLKEQTFTSISGYSPLFTTSIQSEKDKLNIQLGLRKQGLGAGTTFVVGTPIVTIEY